MPHTVSSLIRSAVLAGACFAAACKKVDTTGPVTPASVIVVQGANQMVQGGKELPTPIVVRVLDAEGRPMEAQAVSFVIGAGGGSVSPGSIVSDVNGEAKTKWTLGPNETAQQLDAAVPGLEAVAITATALLPTDIIVAQGNNQTARVGIQLPNSIVIRVVGPLNTPMAGIGVAFQIMSGGGVITPQSAVTNALGEVTAKWTVGTVAGSNSLAVYVGALAPQLLTAIATP